MNAQRLVPALKTAAPAAATLLVAWWAHCARMEELQIQRMKLERELEQARFEQANFREYVDDHFRLK